MNPYQDVETLKSFMEISGTSRDAELLAALVAASREIDDYAGRTFFVETATRVFDGCGGGCLTVDDLLSISSFTVDQDGDGVYEETWTEGTDFVLYPWNKFPKLEVRLTTDSTKALPYLPRSIRIVGDWGYGDGKSATPYEALGTAGTVASTTGTTLTLSVSGILKAGMTIKLGTERMYVQAVVDGVSPTATVVRGVNGSTAAAQAAAAISVYRYPAPIARMAMHMAAEIFRQMPDAGIMSESIGGEYSYTLSSAKNSQDIALRTLGKYRRICVV